MDMASDSLFQSVIFSWIIPRTVHSLPDRWRRHALKLLGYLENCWGLGLIYLPCPCFDKSFIALVASRSARSWSSTMLLAICSSGPAGSLTALAMRRR